MLESLQTLDQADVTSPQPSAEGVEPDRSAEPCSAIRPAEPPEGGRRARRRQIDPTTCERDYSADEIEFMQALDAYKRRSGRMFPTCSEILEVVRSLGYRRPSGTEPAEQIDGEFAG